MNTIFVVLQCAYDYDDNSSFPIFATPYEPIALGKKADMERRLEVRKAAYASLQEQMLAWETINPRPQYGKYADRPLPLFPGNKKTWTTAQKKEYNDAKKANQAASREAGRPFGDWAQLRYAELQRVEATLPDNVQEDLRNLSEINTWEIEQVPYSEQSWQ